jgi:hypothetical protein
MWSSASAAVVCALALCAGSARAGDGWTARPIDARLPDRPAVALGPNGRGVLAYADTRAVWVRAIARDGRLGEPQRITGPRPSTGWAAAAIDGRGAVTVAWTTDAPLSTLVLASWNEGQPPATGAPVSQAGSQVGAVVLTPRAGGGTIAAWSETRLPAAPDQLVAAALVAPERAVQRTEVLTFSPDERPTDIFAGVDAAGRPTIAAKTVAFFGEGPAALVTADSAVADGFSPQRAVRRQPLDGSGLDDLHVLTDGRGSQLAVSLTGPFNGVRRLMTARRPPSERFSIPHALASGRRIQSIAADMTPSGTAAIAWTPQEGGLNPLIARFRARGRWGPSQRLTSRGRSAQQVELVFDGRGHATIAWGSLHGIHARQWRAGRLGADLTISDPWRNRLCWEPSLTVAPHGDAVATFLCTRRAAHPIHGLAHRAAHSTRRRHAALAGRAAGHPASTSSSRARSARPVS